MKVIGIENLKMKDGLSTMSVLSLRSQLGRECELVMKGEHTIKDLMNKEAYNRLLLDDLSLVSTMQCYEMVLSTEDDKQLFTAITAFGPTHDESAIFMTLETLVKKFPTLEFGMGDLSMIAMSLANSRQGKDCWLRIARETDAYYSIHWVTSDEMLTLLHKNSVDPIVIKQIAEKEISNLIRQGWVLTDSGEIWGEYAAKLEKGGREIIISVEEWETAILIFIGGETITFFK